MLQRELRDLAFVRRWAISRTIRDQYVDQHSFYVAVYAEWVWVRMSCEVNGPGCSLGDLLHWALRHDMEESFMSDIPGPVKRNIKDGAKYDEYVGKETQRRFGFDPRDMPNKIKLIIKVADLIDECMYLAGEIQMGNKSLYVFRSNAEKRLQAAMGNITLPAGARDEVLRAIGHQQEGSSASPVNDSDVK